MAKELVHEAELWLPSEFIYDDLVQEAEQGRKEETVTNNESSVTESDEEDYMAGLTQRMAHSFLVDDEKDSSWGFAAADNVKVGDMAGSPQSTLWDWPPSKKGSPDGASLVSSPPLSPGEEEEQQKQPAGDPWVLLSEAAGQVMRLRGNGFDNGRDLNQNGLAAQGKVSTALPVPCNKAGTGYYGPSPAFQQLRAAQFYRLKQLHMMKRQQQQDQQTTPWGKHGKPRGDGGGGGFGDGGRCGQPLGLSPSAWPPLRKQQQQPPPKPEAGEAMRAIFLNNSGARKDAVGTGVFIPRHADNIIDPPRKKQSTCSTVLVPARVVQALNLNLEELGAQPRFPGAYAIDQAALVGRSMSHQKRNHPTPQSTATTASASSSVHELRLPQEWTY